MWSSCWWLSTAFSFIPGWFVTSKMFEKFHDALQANNDILFSDEDFNKGTFFTNQINPQNMWWSCWWLSVALNFIPGWFVTSKMLEDFHDALQANNDILFFHEDCNKATFFSNQIVV